MRDTAPAIVFGRDGGSHLESPGTIRVEGVAVGLWWGEASFGAPSQVLFLAICARCEEQAFSSYRQRDVRDEFAGHWRAVHVEGDPTQEEAP